MSRLRVTPNVAIAGPSITDFVEQSPAHPQHGVWLCRTRQDSRIVGNRLSVAARKVGADVRVRTLVSVDATNDYVDVFFTVCAELQRGENHG